MVRLFVGHSIFASAVVTLIVRARLAGLDESLEEASADLYAPPGADVPADHAPADDARRARRRRCSRSASAWTTRSSRRSSRTADASPWPVYVFSSLRSVLRPQIAAMSTLMLLLTLFALALVAIVLRRSGATDEEAFAMIVGAEAAPSAPGK